MSGVTLYYMRDNHTFRALPLDVEEALKIMRDERDAGQTYGMLCSKMVKDVVHAPSAAEWDGFEQRARVWLEAAIQVKVPPTPEEELTRLRAELAAMTARAEKAEAERNETRAELARLTTLRPASEHDTINEALWWNSPEDFVSASYFPDGRYWTPLPDVKAAKP